MEKARASGTRLARQAGEGSSCPETRQPDHPMPIDDVSRASARPAPHMRRAGDFVVTRDQVDAVVPLHATGPTTPPSSRLSRPDASFVAHLIAMAEQDPQTRVLRRAAISDVEAAYSAAANQNQPARPGGLRACRTA